MPVQRVFAQRGELFGERPPLRGGKAGRDTDVVQGAAPVEEPEEQRAHPSVLVPPEARDRAIRGPFVLHLQHGPLAFAIAEIGRLELGSAARVRLGSDVFVSDG